MSVPLFVAILATYGMYQICESGIDEFQKPYDIREFHKSGLPLVGTLRQRRRAREAAEDERRYGHERRKANAQEQEWKRISELK